MSDPSDLCEDVASESYQDEDSPRESVRERDRPAPRYASFLTQVLYSVHYIRLKRGHGATIGEIASFQRKYFGATGDVHSRVTTSVEKAVGDGFLLEKDGRHVPVTPLARLLNAGTPQERADVLKQMQKVFLYKTNLRRDRRKEFVRRDASTLALQEKRAVSKSDIVAILRRIEYVVMDHFAEAECRCATDASSTPREPRPKVKSSDLRINMLGGAEVKVEPSSAARQSRTPCDQRSAQSRRTKRSRSKRDSSGSASGSHSRSSSQRTSRCAKRRRT